MLFKSLFLILSYERVPVARLVEPVLEIDTGLARLNFAHLAHSLIPELAHRCSRTVICVTYNSARARRS